MINDGNIMHYNNSCSVCCIVLYLNVTKSELWFLIKHCLNTVCFHYSRLHLHFTCILLGLWYNHSPFYSAKLWTGKSGCPSTKEGAGFVYKKYLC